MAAHAALRSAALNVQVNAKVIKDAEFVAQATARLESILAGVGNESEAIFQLVWEKL
jgi:formiminotetrahydrofolate cyclodeaminase